MCTIGAVKADQFNGMLAFKQCDLEVKTNFLTPIVNGGLGDIQYMKFMREGSNGG